MIKKMLIKRIAAIACAAVLMSGLCGTTAYAKTYNSASGNNYSQTQMPDGQNGRMQNGKMGGRFGRPDMGSQFGGQGFGGQMPNGQMPNGQNNGTQQNTTNGNTVRPDMNTQNGTQNFGGQMQNGQNNGMTGQNSTSGNVDSALEIVESDVVNTAKNLAYDTSSATTIVMSDSNSSVKISESGTYIVTGSCSDGSIALAVAPLGVSENSQFLRPTTNGLIAFSARLLLISIPGSARKPYR